MVATPSVNPGLEAGGSGEGEMASLTAGWLRSWGYGVDIVEAAPGRLNVVARLEGMRSGARLLFNGHLDTVGVEGMTVPPFEGRLDGGRLLGRGACDMKGGVASALAAGARLAKEGLEVGELWIVLTADEEMASLGMDHFVSSGGRADAAVVCEPTELAVMPAHKGFLWLDLLFRGRAAHGSLPEVGIDAIRHAARYLERLDELEAELQNRPAHPLLGHGSFHAGTISGGTAPSVYPAECRLNLERRTLPGVTASEAAADFQRLLAALEAELGNLRAELTPGLFRPGTEVPEEAPLVQGLLGSCARLGLPERVSGMTAWVDAAFLNESGTPAVCFGPGSTDQAHTADEWCDTAQIERCADVLEMFARSFLSGAGA
jgi:acetylornithine deacetylase